MTLGYVHEIVRDGKVIYVEDSEATECSLYNDLFSGSNGKFEGQGISSELHSR
jgi:hypothetical protein